MRYSTIKELYQICDNDELRGDFNTDKTRTVVIELLNKPKFIKSYLDDLRFDIKDCIKDIREKSFLSDYELLSGLLKIKNDYSLQLKALCNSSKLEKSKQFYK